MAVVNIAFDLAPEIVEGLATGAYKLFGGVVRDQAGRIVCFLPEALNAVEASQAATKAVASVARTTTKAVTKTPIAKTAVTTTTKKAPSLFRTIGHFAKAHPVGTTFTVVAVLAGAGYGVYRWYQNKKVEQAELDKAPEYIEHFNSSLDAYYNALQTGTLSESIVSDLISAIDDMRAAVSNGTVKMEFSAEQVNNMLGILSYFTKEFAGANHYEYTEPEKPQHNDTCSNLLYFTDYLKIQRDIYRAA